MSSFLCLRNNCTFVIFAQVIDISFIFISKSQLLALLLCIGSASIALGNRQAEQRFLDVLRDLYKENVLNIEDLSF